MHQSVGLSDVVWLEHPGEKIIVAVRQLPNLMADMGNFGVSWIAASRLNCVDHATGFVRANGRIFSPMECPDRYVFQSVCPFGVTTSGQRNDSRPAIG